ncbi:MAG: sialate O-acetylesterase [bacterium]
MRRRTALFVLMTVVLGLQSLAVDGLKVAFLFTDHMVLQREMPVPVWGWADPGVKVTVEFAGQTKTALADASGKWSVKLDAMFASAVPSILKISRTPNPDPSAGGVSAKVEPLIITDVLVGDVWLCSGQSNMKMEVWGCAQAEEEIANGRYPEIRLFTVAPYSALTPTNAVVGAWEPCSTQTVGKFPAVAYFFGRELHKELKIPIGLLHSAVGATAAEAWTRLEALKTIPALAERAEAEISQIKSQENDNKRFVTDRTAWEKKYSVEPPPVAEAARNWADPELKTDDWSSTTNPNQWVQLGTKSGGVFWVRRDVTLPESAAGKPFFLGLKWLSEQYDTTFFNGVEVGRASDKAPDFYNQARHYKVPGKLVKAGRNVIAMRIVSATKLRVGNMLGLPVADQAAVGNKWLMKTESTFPALPPEALKSRPKPNTIPFRSVSASLYNGMIAPLIPFAFKGAIWYQGESNAGRAGEYRKLLSLMIRDWRAQWGRSFPFIIQQLVNNGAPAKDSNETGNWPLVREAQMQVADALPSCGVAIGIELGSAVTIHPPNKQDVGKRLALVALEKTYGQKIESSGPRFDSMKVEGSAIRVTFTHAAGLIANGGPLKNFSIAGANRMFFWADAKIADGAVIVSSPQVPQPVAVRYAWADNPEGCALFNQSGLPAAPFRTDDWK